ncbi:MAG: DUF4339 domain-containing protein [Opitutaceae bacterium]|nr:DUF4339 domain-containing protein [Opitutaceae bacterium]
MATQEIYIRNATETEARGPFSAQQVADLAEAGQVDGETLIYDAGTEQWVALNTNAELMAVVFPEKRKLALKAKEIKTLNKPDATSKPITVNEMLAAAEGRTDDTKDKRDPEQAMARAAKIGMLAAMAALLVAAAGEALPAVEALTTMDTAKMMQQPLVFLGIVDLALAVLLGLGMSTIYPIVRFRAALGLGLIGFMFYAEGLTIPLAQVAAGSIGLYLCTVVVSLVPAIVAAVAAVGGMGTLAWYLLSH